MSWLYPNDLKVGVALTLIKAITSSYLWPLSLLRVNLSADARRQRPLRKQDLDEHPPLELTPATRLDLAVHLHVSADDEFAGLGAG